jgi:hypothetical protein
VPSSPTTSPTRRCMQRRSRRRSAASTRLRRTRGPTTATSSLTSWTSGPERHRSACGSIRYARPRQQQQLLLFLPRSARDAFANHCPRARNRRSNRSPLPCAFAPTPIPAAGSLGVWCRARAGVHRPDEHLRLAGVSARLPLGMPHLALPRRPNVCEQAVVRHGACALTREGL